jgi:hypothetical protein
MYVRIYQDKKSATQSAPRNNRWIVECLPNLSGSYISANMQWNGSKDVQKQVKLHFETFEKAKEFSISNRWNIIYDGGDPKDKINPKSYLKNFK